MDWREDRIGSAARGQNPTVLAELRSGYAVIGDVQFLPGYCVPLGKDPHAKAPADMPWKERVQFLADADLLATAVECACREADPGSGAPTSTSWSTWTLSSMPTSGPATSRKPRS